MPVVVLGGAGGRGGGGGGGGAVSHRQCAKKIGRARQGQVRALRVITHAGARCCHHPVNQADSSSAGSPHHPVLPST